MSDLCEYSKKTADAELKCKITKDYCGRCRYCYTRGRIVMTSGYENYGCSIKNNYQEEKKCL